MCVIVHADYGELLQYEEPPSIAVTSTADPQVTKDPGTLVNSSERLEKTKSPFQQSGLELSNNRNCSNTTVPNLSSSTVNSVKRFVFFVGYARSGHSMIGSVMDAHPNMAIAHEYFVFEECKRLSAVNINIFQDKQTLFNNLYSNSYLSSKCGWRSDTNTSKGYNFNLDFKWQGTFRDELRVIGDKSGNSAMQVLKHGDKCLRDMSSLNVSLTAVHVVRNPFDVIATSILYKVNKGTGNRKTNVTVKVVGEGLVYQMARLMFTHASTITRLKSTEGLSVVEVHIEDYIKSPRAFILQMCRYFDLECPPDYVQECVNKTYRHVSRTRDFIEWPPKILSYIQQHMKRYSFFNGYTLEDSFRQLV